MSWFSSIATLFSGSYGTSQAAALRSLKNDPAAQAMQTMSRYVDSLEGNLADDTVILTPLKTSWSPSTR